MNSGIAAIPTKTGHIRIPKEERGTSPVCWHRRNRSNADIDARGDTAVKDLFTNGRRQGGPILAPLGARRAPHQRLRDILDNMPSAAAPIAFTLVGGLAIIVVLGTILAGGQDRTPRQVGQEQTAITTAEATPDNAPASEPELPLIANAAPLPVVERQPDPASTASILTAAPHPSVFEPNVEIAETEADIAALEAIQRQEVEDDIGLAVPEARTSIDEPGPAMRAAVTTSYVNMRAGEGDAAEVLEVVPAQAQIEAQEECDWCAVAYDGRTGYIYRTFIDYR